MASREIGHYLDDMRSAIEGIQEAVANESFESFQASWLLRRAVERGIEIISEASRGLPQDLIAERPEVPWAKVRAIGNVLRHEYHHLSATIIWNVVVDELPRLKSAVDAMMARLARR